MAKSHKVIITCAVTGSIHTPSMSPHLPVTAQLRIDFGNLAILTTPGLFVFLRVLCGYFFFFFVVDDDACGCAPVTLAST